MNKKNVLLSFLSLWFPLICLADNKPIICDPPQGTRVDYFLVNNINLKNQTFIMGRDQVAGMKPQIFLNNDTKTVSFVIGDASQIKSQPKSGNMQVLMYNEDQISFLGLVNNAPILATYYPKIGILIYSQQSIWPGPDFQGARAVLFYSQCKI